MSIAIVAAVVVVIAAIVAIGVARPRRDRQDRIDVVFRTRLEAAGVEILGGRATPRRAGARSVGDTIAG